MTPTPGDRWVRQIEVVSVTSKTVRMRQNIREFDMTLAEYDELSDACLRAGDKLTPGPTVKEEEVFFE